MKVILQGAMPFRRLFVTFHEQLLRLCSAETHAPYLGMVKRDWTQLYFSRDSTIL